MADFDPHQLDQLEDALEGLEQLDDLGSLELSPALTERLAEYQSVLAVCRDAFPVAEPRADVLADVLAEAHAVSRRARVREPEQGRWQRFWQRWRGTLIPGVALAGTAVAVLLLLEPDEQLASSAKHDQDAANHLAGADDSPSEPASEPAPSEEGEDGDGKDTREDAGKDTSGAAVEQPGDPDLVAPESKATGVRPPADKPSVATPKSRKSKPGPEPEPAVAPSPLSKDETWTALERANADRRQGDCDRARAGYEQIIAASHDSLAVARAKAGIGLCFEQDRRSVDAQQWYEQARSGNAGIDAWIETQRDEQPLPGETKKPKSKKTSSKPSNKSAATDSL